MPKSSLSKLREGERCHGFQLLFSPEEIAQLESVADTLGWSKSAVIRYGIGLVEQEQDKILKKDPDPPGYRRRE